MPRLAALVFALIVAASHHALAQEAGTRYAERGPRFLLASASTSAGPVRVDVARTPVLRRRISLNLQDVPLPEALREISQQSGMHLAFSSTVLPSDRLVRFRADKITVAAALTELLLDAQVDILFSHDGRGVLVRRQEGLAQIGTVVGRVTDAKTQAGLVGATVLVVGTNRGTTTGNDGSYRIEDVVPGTYTVQGRYIGYAPGSASVTVSAGQEATADFALEKSPQRLDEVVTTGTVVPTEVKALPTPITVISADDIEAQRPRTVSQVFRQAVPSAVAWDLSANPEQTALSTRGAAGLNPGSGTMKIYIDGIETADRSLSALDPNSIERVEVIRGPQAATIYGSDAIGGVVQVFTKRGDLRSKRPQVNASAALGLIQSPFDETARQEYAGAISGGGASGSYNLGGGYVHHGDWIPGGNLSVLSGFGAMHFQQGPLTLDASARSYVTKTPQEMDPRFAATGFLPFSKPTFHQANFRNETVGARVGYSPTSWWHHNVTVGIDRALEETHQTQPRLTTPSDTFLFMDGTVEGKTSLAYNTSANFALGRDFSATLTLGLDHYALAYDSYSTFGALNATGTIATDPSQPLQLTHAPSRNTGYFAQTVVGLRDDLFLTVGIRDENNTNFGGELGSHISPRIGLSYIQPISALTVKLRGSYGEAIHPPDPGLRDAHTNGGFRTLANPDLGPERQRGWDGGLDLVGAHGSLGFTYYDQVALDLITLVNFSDGFTNQFQNLSRIKNNGIELEGTLLLGVVQARAQFATANSQPEDLGPGYTGDLRVGEQLPLVPKHTAGVSVTVSPWKATSISGGVTYVGSWTTYDYLALFSCFGGTGPCRATFRDYLTPYPALTKVNLSITQALTPSISSFAAVDNLTNTQAHEFFQATPPLGRITMIGIRARY